MFHFLYTGTESKIQLYKQLCASLEHTSVYDVLIKVDDSYLEEFFLHYLHDFVRLVHSCNHNNELNEVQYKVLLWRGALTRGPAVGRN